MKYTVLLLIAGLSCFTHGALIPTYTTGADGTTPGNITFTNGGSWTGDGTVKPVIADLGNANSSPSALLIENFSDGDLLLTDVNLAGTSAAYTPAGMSAMHSIFVDGGSASLTALYTSAPTGNQHNFLIEPTAGTDSITYTMKLSHALHSRRRSSQVLLPWLGSLQMPTSARTNITIDGIFTLTSTDGTVANATSSPGIAGGLANATVAGKSLGALSVPTGNPDAITYFRTTTGGESHINSIIPDDPGDIHNASSAGQYAAGPQGDANLNDGERVYADSITWFIRPDSGTFTGSEQFLFSFDGGRSAAIPVPEPTGAALLGLGGIALLIRRTRK